MTGRQLITDAQNTWCPGVWKFFYPAYPEKYSFGDGTGGEIA